jgi:class 3 adenylate cyclase
MYLDVHEIDGVFSLEDVAAAHAADMAIQEKHGVNYLKYWCNEQKGRVFCMCTAPSAEAAERVHMESSGMRAERIVEVDEDFAESLMGAHTVNPAGCVIVHGKPDPGARTILFTDIVGSTELTQQLGDQAAMAVVEAHDRVVRGALAAHGGREVKHLGDGIMAAFLSPQEACACAERIQRDLRALDSGNTQPIWLKIGAASGDPLERDGDFFGTTVQLASRLCAHATAGQILVSPEVAARTSTSRFGELGEVKLKGFAEPVRALKLLLGDRG